MHTPTKVRLRKKTKTGSDEENPAAQGEKE
jgi:hypothetical protein